MKNTKNVSKSDYTDYLNEIGIPEDDKQSNGGRIPDHSKYGAWLRKNDPIAFNVGYNEYSNYIEYSNSKRT